MFRHFRGTGRLAGRLFPTVLALLCGVEYMKRRPLVTAVACFFLMAPFLAASASFAAAPTNESFLSNGVKIHYVTAGEGEPVVLIHGFCANVQNNWILPGIFAKLAKHYHVIALDNRGHGLSGKPHEVEKYGPEMVEDVVRLLDHLKIEKAHIVGYSMGGFITGALVTTHPERVISAVMGGAGWSRDTDDHAVIDALAKSLDEGHGITPLMKALTPPGKPQLTEEELKTRNQFIMLANDPKALSACIRGMLKLHVSRESLEKNQVPVLAVCGEVDPLKKGVDAMDGVAKNLTVVIVKGGDHMSTIRSPIFEQSIEDFIAAHSKHPATASTAK
jgi:pimeloyl-ACP methyl ester carboxylesterase